VDHVGVAGAVGAEGVIRAALKFLRNRGDRGHIGSEMSACAPTALGGQVVNRTSKLCILVL